MKRTDTLTVLRCCHNARGALVRRHCVRRPRLRPTLAAATAEATQALSIQTSAKAPEIRTKELLAPVFRIDRVYKLMTGPRSTEDFLVEAAAKPELL